MGGGQCPSPLSLPSSDTPSARNGFYLLESLAQGYPWKLPNIHAVASVHKMMVSPIAEDSPTCLTNMEK